MHCELTKFLEFATWQDPFEYDPHEPFTYPKLAKSILDIKLPDGHFTWDTEVEDCRSTLNLQNCVTSAWSGTVFTTVTGGARLFECNKLAFLKYVFKGFRKFFLLNSTNL